MPLRSIRNAGFVLALLMPLFSIHAFAQSGSATLEGTVTDPTGSVVPNATVTITSEETGTERQVTSNQSGIYSAPDLPAGSYKVSTSATGFGTREVEHIVLTVGGVRDVDVQLLVGGTETRVTVEASVNTVDTATSAVQGVVDGKQTRDLPLNGRDWTTLAALQPGVSSIATQFASTVTATTRLNRGLGNQVTIGGNRPQQNAYRLDGVIINDYANGSPGSVSGVTLGVDAVQEFSVITSNAAAAYGRSSGGVINSITRSGTNDFHGSFYDYLRNSVFDARNFFDPGPVPSFRRNQFGLALGGPILKDKTFFFLNYEGFRQSLGTTLIDVVPSLSARQGPVDPKVAPYLGLYNLPNSNVTGNTGNFVFTTQQPTNEDFATLHLDHNFSSKDTLHATGLFDKSDSTSADNSDAVIDLAITRRWTGVLEEVHVFSPSLTNAARFGYSRSVASAPRQTGVINPAAADTRLGFVPGATPGALIVSGLTTFNGGPGAVGTNTFNYNAYQLYDDATLVRGTHSISFGGSVERDQDNERGGLLPFGEWNFGSVANFLANVPSFYEAGLPSTPVTPRYLRQTIAAGYVQDDWRIRKEFTLNLGLRYEMATNLSEARNRLSQLIHLTDPAPVQVNHFFANNPTLKNFEPRLGFAWDVGGRAKTVIRGAFGIYDVLPLSYLFELNTISAAPFYDEGRNTTVARGSFPNGAFAGTTPKLRQFYTQQNPGRTYVMQASFNVEEQLTPNTTMTVGYIGSHGVRQPFNANDMNIVLPVLKSPVGYVWPKAGTGVQTNPNVGSIVGTLFNGSSLYHSLQASLKYASNRMTAQLSYTWSHSIDDSSSSLGGASFGNSNANPPYFDVRLGRGSSDFDVRHVLTANTVIALPSPGKNRGFWAAPLRGWTFNNIITVRTGLPFTPTIGGDPLGLLSSAGGFGFPDIVPGVGSCTNGHNVNYLNTACFKFPGTYQYAPGLFGPILGNAGRNNISGPGIFNWTTGIQKDTVLTERVRLQLQAQAFNVTNHTNFAPPQSTQAQIFNAGGALLSTAGQLTLTTTTSRQLQFAVKFLF